MAYIVGLLSPEEKQELERRGWEIEAAPKDLIPPEPTPGKEMAMVFVDTSMFDVMSGPDWDKGE